MLALILLFRAKVPSEQAKGTNKRTIFKRNDRMVGTRHAVSDNKSINGLGMPIPYIAEVRRRKTIVNESTFGASQGY